MLKTALKTIQTFVYFFVVGASYFLIGSYISSEGSLLLAFSLFLDSLFEGGLLFFFLLPFILSIGVNTFFKSALLLISAGILIFVIAAYFLFFGGGESGGYFLFGMMIWAPYLVLAVIVSFGIRYVINHISKKQVCVLAILPFLGLIPFSIYASIIQNNSEASSEAFKEQANALGVIHKQFLKAGSIEEIINICQNPPEDFAQAYDNCISKYLHSARLNRSNNPNENTSNAMNGFYPATQEIMRLCQTASDPESACGISYLSYYFLADLANIHSLEQAQQFCDEIELTYFSDVCYAFIVISSVETNNFDIDDDKAKNFCYRSERMANSCFFRISK